MIQHAQKQSKSMKWLIHGEGCGTFVQALRFIKANPVASDIITAQKGMGNQDDQSQVVGNILEALGVVCVKPGSINSQAEP